MQPLLSRQSHLKTSYMFEFRRNDFYFFYLETSTIRKLSEWYFRNFKYSQDYDANIKFPFYPVNPLII